MDTPRQQLRELLLQIQSSPFWKTSKGTKPACFLQAQMQFQLKIKLENRS